VVYSEKLFSMATPELGIGELGVLGGCEVFEDCF
jgi:hypothetical protein